MFDSRLKFQTEILVSNSRPKFWYNNIWTLAQLKSSFKHYITNYFSNYLSFYVGIPYANPPTGKLRLMPPVTSAHFSGIKEADQFGSACPQPMLQSSFKNLGSTNLTSEDCLYLNIYTPISGKCSLSDWLIIISLIDDQTTN